MARNAYVQVSLTVALWLVAGVAAAELPANLVGVWTAISDEDGTPADVFKITSDGRIINYGFNCQVYAEMPYHVFRGDIYVTSEIDGKGPIAIVFRPSADGSALTYTSPRTRNNAIYGKLPENPCETKG